MADYKFQIANNRGILLFYCSGVALFLFLSLSLSYYRPHAQRRMKFLIIADQRTAPRSLPQGLLAKCYRSPAITSNKGRKNAGRKFDFSRTGAYGSLIRERQTTRRARSAIKRSDVFYDSALRKAIYQHPRVYVCTRRR